MSTPLTITRSASCLCRSVTFKVTGDPLQFIVCHCNNCRKMAGGAFMTNLFYEKENVTIPESSLPFLTRYDDTSTRSGNTLRREFCSKCGSSLFLHVASFPNHVIVALPAIEGEKHDWLPTREGYEKLPWVEKITMKGAGTATTPVEKK